MSIFLLNLRMAVSAGSLGGRHQRAKPSSWLCGVSRWWGRSSGGQCQGSDPRRELEESAGGELTCRAPKSAWRVGGTGWGGGGDRGARGRCRPSWAGRPRVAGRWRAAAGGGAATSWRRRPGPLSALSAGAGSPRPPPCPIRPASKVTAPEAARGKGAPGRLRPSRAGYGTGRAGVGPGGREPVSRGTPGLCASPSVLVPGAPGLRPSQPGPAADTLQTDPKFAEAGEIRFRGGLGEGGVPSTAPDDSPTFPLFIR